MNELINPVFRTGFFYGVSGIEPYRDKDIH